MDYEILNKAIQIVDRWVRIDREDLFDMLEEEFPYATDDELDDIIDHVLS